MDRNGFERLRDLPNKTIEIDIRLQPKRDRAGVYQMEDIPIRNSENVDARLKISWNVYTDAKCINVHVKGVGPICRLDVGGDVHEPYGRNHKHSLKKPTCPENNLNLEIQVRNDLNGKNVIVIPNNFRNDLLRKE